MGSAALAGGNSFSPIARRSRETEPLPFYSVKEFRLCCAFGRVRDRATIVQKTGRPVQFEITEQTRAAIQAWLADVRAGTTGTSFPAGSERSRTYKKGKIMPGIARVLTLLSCALCYFFATTAVAQKTGGILKFFHRDSPANMSIHEEATISTVGPTMAVRRERSLPCVEVTGLGPPAGAGADGAPRSSGDCQVDGIKHGCRCGMTARST